MPAENLTAAQALGLEGLGSNAVRMLLNPNRRKLLFDIAQAGVATTQQLFRLSGLGWGTLNYHLGALMRAHVVESRIVSRRRVYYVRSPSANRFEGILEVLSSPALEKLARLILGQPGLCQRDLQAHLACSQRMASYYLRKLERLNLVLREKDRNRARYQALPRLSEVLSAPPVPVLRPVGIASTETPRLPAFEALPQASGELMERARNLPPRLVGPQEGFP